MLRRIGVALGLLAVAAGVAAVALTTARGRGYFGPVFAPDAASVYVLVRDVSASVVGLGYDSFTPPASVWIHRDRFSLVAIRVADGRITLVRDFPASPLEGSRISTYHGAIFGEASGHLHWADADHLDYELTVTRPDSPSAHTFVWRHRWSAKTGTTEDSTSWQPGYASMTGDEPSQLHGDREVIGVRGPELMPCAVVILRTGDAAASPLVDSGTCGDRFAGGFTREALETRRAAIEHTALVEESYADLVAEGRARGLSEGAALLQARQGHATPRALSENSDDHRHRRDLRRRATDLPYLGPGVSCRAVPGHRAGHRAPGEEIDFNGSYVTHRDYNTSRLLNDFLADRSHREFLVDGHGGCWRLRIDHRQ